MSPYFKTIMKSLSINKSETKMDRWFTREEQLLLIDQIKQIIELANVSIGDTDDQALLMNLLADELNSSPNSGV